MHVFVCVCDMCGCMYVYIDYLRFGGKGEVDGVGCTKGNIIICKRDETVTNTHTYVYVHTERLATFTKTCKHF